MSVAAHRLRFLSVLLCAYLLAAPDAWAASGPTPAAAGSFLSYAAATEARLLRQHRAPDTFLVPLGPEARSRLRAGELLVESVSPPGGLPFPGALLHHWRGTAFAPGATATDMETLLRDVPAYPKTFGPQVLTAHITAERGDYLLCAMRVRQHHVLTVVMDTEYRMDLRRLDNLHGYSLARSLRVTEISSPGTAAEKPMREDEEHGFLWRQNTYWSWEERDGGLLLQLESISLSRAIPAGLRWVVRPFLESVPRESLAFTLDAVRAGLRQPPQ